MARLIRIIRAAMVGDCSYCGHSIIYHMVGMGCVKIDCDCDEYH